ncbi:hypothetical protein D6C91_02540 [Aureobasidium pullulans]|uniref:F-box domain-containing protein n=1 Tax=Aureobasidium pullulans TaxID=5580 RepID=A0A4S9TNS9_AURPU|nr:hypothetical protein D6C91_02540 [Aureobasidium pullulans]
MSASKCRITPLDMPDEMLNQIAYTVEPEALALLRLTCKAVCDVVNKPFGEHFLAHRRFILTKHSIRIQLEWNDRDFYGEPYPFMTNLSRLLRHDLELENLEIRNLMCDHSDNISPPIIAYSGHKWCGDVEEVRAGFDGLIAQMHTRRERLLMEGEEDGDYSGPEWSDEDDGFEESDYELERENRSEDESDTESTDQDDEAIWDM